MTAPPTAPTILHVAAVEYTAEFLLLPQLHALRAAGFSVRVACTPGPTGFSDKLAPFAPIDVRFPRSLRPVAMMTAAVRLAGVVRRLRPDVLHLHSPAAAIVARILPRRWLPQRTRIVYTVHGFPHQWDAPTLRDRVLQRLERRQAASTDALLFQSSEDLEAARAHAFPTRLLYLGNGVADEWFEPAPPPPPRAPLRLLFIGRLVREKGLLDLLDAVAQLPQLHLSIAGGELPSERDGIGDLVRARCATAPLDGRVRLLGVIPAEALRREIVASHAVVLPSYREGLPRSLIEGMATGRPAIATDIRGCREVVEDGTSGFLFPPGDSAQLATRIRRLAQLDAAAYAAMCAAARDSASHRYRESVVFGRLIDAYRDVGVTADPEAVR